MQTIANRPIYSYNPTIRDGNGIINNQGSMPNYIPGNLDDVTIVTKSYEVAAHEQWTGTVTSFDSTVTDADYVQPRDFYENVLSKTDQDHLISNLAASIIKVKHPEIRQGTYGKLSHTCWSHQTNTVYRDFEEDQHRLGNSCREVRGACYTGQESRSFDDRREDYSHLK
jgi:catalase